MAKLVVNSESLVSVADAIRTKGGTTEDLKFPQGFVDAVGAIESGGGIQYTDIVYNDDNTVTLTDTLGVEHTISCVYENNRLLSITYDGKEVVTVYDNGELVSVGETEVDVANAPLDNTLENLIDQSGVLGSTDETVTVTEKVEQLIDKAEELKMSIEVSGKRVSFRSDYEGVIESFIIPYTDFSNADSLYYFCYNSGVTDIPFYINSPKCTSAYAAFSKTPNLKHMVGMDTSKVTSAFNFFFQSAIEEIDEPFNFSSLTNESQGVNFNNCPNLRKLMFEEETIKVSTYISNSPYLDKDISVPSIIKGLAYVTEKRILKLHANIVLTDEQKATIRNKGWTLVQ